MGVPSGGEVIGWCDATAAEVAIVLSMGTHRDLLVLGSHDHSHAAGIMRSPGSWAPARTAAGIAAAFNSRVEIVHVVDGTHSERHPVLEAQIAEIRELTGEKPGLTEPARARYPRDHRGRQGEGVFADRLRPTWPARNQGARQRQRASRAPSTVLGSTDPSGRGRVLASAGIPVRRSWNHRSMQMWGAGEQPTPACR